MRRGLEIPCCFAYTSPIQHAWMGGSVPTQTSQCLDWWDSIAYCCKQCHCCLVMSSREKMLNKPPLRVLWHVPVHCISVSGCALISDTFSPHLPTATRPNSDQTPPLLLLHIPHLKRSKVCHSNKLNSAAALDRTPAQAVDKKIPVSISYCKSLAVCIITVIRTYLRLYAGQDELSFMICDKVWKGIVTQDFPEFDLGAGLLDHFLRAPPARREGVWKLTRFLCAQEEFV